MSNQLEELARLGQMILDAELSDLKSIQEKMENQTKFVATLDQQLQTRFERVIHENDDLALTTGQDALWQAWLRDQRSESNAVLANLAAAREDKMVHARRSFGRAQAIDALQKRAQSERALETVKRRAHDHNQMS